MPVCQFQHARGNHQQCNDDARTTFGPSCLEGGRSTAAAQVYRLAHGEGLASIARRYTYLCTNFLSVQELSLGLADEFERRLERLVEGFFSKAFRSDLEAAEIGRRLLREQEGGKTVSVGAVYVPNRYVISLSERDYERFEGLLPELQKEFSKLLKENARQRRWKLPGSISISFAADLSIKEGSFSTRAAHEGGNDEEEMTDNAYPRLKRAGGDDEWVLDVDEVTIGRLSTNEVFIPGSDVSREHAQIVRREDGWWILDAGSTNGTFVNDAVVKERRLKSGDRVSIGSVEMIFSEPEAE